MEAVTLRGRVADKDLVSLGNMMLRGSSLLCRLGLVFYIARQLGLEAMALYGFTIGAAALMTAVSGLGISWQVNRIMAVESGAWAAARARDRVVQRLVILIPVIACCTMIAVQLAILPMPLAGYVAGIVMLESLIGELSDFLVYRCKSLAGNTLLFLRSGSWIPAIILCGFLDARWRSIDAVMLGWLVGLILSIGFVLALAMASPVARSGLQRAIDWSWIHRSSKTSPIVFVSELGAVGLLYSDRYIIGLLLGGRAAGAFTFVWSIINAVVPIVQGGVFNQMMPQLTSQWHRHQWGGWLTSFSDGMRRTTWVSAALGMVALAALIVILRVAELPLSLDTILFGTLMVVATVLRMRADVVHHALYSAGQDSDWIAVNILGLILGPCMALIGIASFGFIGAGVQMVLVAYALYTMRSRLARRTIRRAQIASGQPGALAI